MRSPERTETEEDHDPGAWAHHVALATGVINDGIELGRVPADLAEKTALLGLGGPGNCAIRGLVRRLTVDGEETDQAFLRHDFRDAALRIAWGFRTLFNLPTIAALVQGSDTYPDLPYWQRAAATGVAGNLQAVLDEYLHVLPEWLGLVGQESARAAREIGNAVHDAVSIRASNYRAEQVRVNGRGIEFEPHNIRVRFALRFGTTTSEDQRHLIHESAVRSAFNSPFWPFVLATTSVGQEGLDFHQYCHAVVHWNLPANPVDLEQREGRVHRYKGHAVRKNLAERHRDTAFRNGVRDPWSSMFDEAAASIHDPKHRDISPFWVYEGSARIERILPFLPLSREIPHMRRLHASLAAYRMVMGQSRQEDLIELLQHRMSPDDLELLMQQLRIDLSPERSKASATSTVS